MLRKLRKAARGSQVFLEFACVHPTCPHSLGASNMGYISILYAVYAVHAVHEVYTACAAYAVHAVYAYTRVYVHAYTNADT